MRYATQNNEKLFDFYRINNFVKNFLSPMKMELHMHT